jgi:hypothetical protein
MTDDEEGWPKDPKDIYMIEYHETGDEEHDIRVHRKANENWIKDLLRDKVITHPKQLSWYSPDQFHVHPSFYKHHIDEESKGEQVELSPFSDMNTNFMPSSLPTMILNEGYFLLGSSLSSSSTTSSTVPADDQTNKTKSKSQSQSTSNNSIGTVDTTDDFKHVNATLSMYGIYPKNTKKKKAKLAAVSKATGVDDDSDDDFEPRVIVTPSQKRKSSKRKQGPSAAISATHRTSSKLVQDKDLWEHVPEATRAQMPPFKKYKFKGRKKGAKDMAHPPIYGNIPDYHCKGCRLHKEVCHEVLFGEFCIANVMMYYDMARADTTIDGVNEIYETSYNQALRFKRYEAVKILDYYSSYPPPKCMMSNSYLHASQLAMFKAKGDKYLDSLVTGANSLSRQQEER